MRPTTRPFNEAPIGNGPFMIKPGTKWEHNQGISLVRNDTYFGTKPSLDGIEFLIFPAQGRLEAEYRAFTAGEADFARVPPSLFTQAKNTYEPQGSFLKIERFGINYILTNDVTGPMANPDARRAVSLAIDREAINEGVFQGSLTPATALLPPPFGDVHQDGVCGDCTFDVAKAKDLAAKGGLTPGTPLRLLYNNDGGHEALVQAWKDQLERNLGVVVTSTACPSPRACSSGTRASSTSPGPAGAPTTRRSRTSCSPSSAASRRTTTAATTTPRSTP